MASCWVSVEPPCAAPRRKMSRTMARRTRRADRCRNANRSGGPRWRRRRSVGKPAIRSSAPRRRPCRRASPASRRSSRGSGPTAGAWEFRATSIGGRCMPIQTMRADAGDHAPQRQHDAPIDDAAEAGAAFWPPPLPPLPELLRFFGLRGGDSRRRRLVSPLAAPPPVRSAGVSRTSRLEPPARLRPSRHAMTFGTRSQRQ